MIRTLGAMSATKPSTPRSLVLPMKGILHTVGIGLAAGVYPALRASRLTPVDAIRAL